MENTTSSQIDIRQSPPYAQYIKSLGWHIESVEQTQIFIRKLGWLGSIAKIQRFDRLNWSLLKPILKRHRVWMTKAEPGWANSNFPIPGFRLDSWPMLATKTLRVNLRPTIENIFKQFKKDCRYSLRKLSNTKVKVVKNDFESFYQIWKRAAGIKKLWTPSKKDYDSLRKCFGENVFCITINHQAGCLVLISGHIAYYYYSGSLPLGKKNNLPYLIVWEAMKEAKKRKCHTWDFEGIFDARFPNKSWQGFTHFKKSFGGYEVSFPGSFIKWF